MQLAHLLDRRADVKRIGAPGAEHVSLADRPGAVAKAQKPPDLGIAHQARPLVPPGAPSGQHLPLRATMGALWRKSLSSASDAKASAGHATSKRRSERVYELREEDDPPWNDLALRWADRLAMQRRGHSCVVAEAVTGEAPPCPQTWPPNSELPERVRCAAQGRARRFGHLTNAVGDASDGSGRTLHV